MIDSIINEILSGIAGACIAIIITWLRRLFSYIHITQPSKNFITGTWIGEISQEETIEDYPDKYYAEVQLNVWFRRIYGVIKYTLPNETFSLDVSGGFHSDNLITLNYKHQKQSTAHIGTAILKPNFDNSLLEGRFLGFGSISDNLVTGKVRLKKDDIF